MLLAAAAVGLLSLGMASRPAAAASYSWNTPQATVLPNGDLAWAPQAFAYTPGASVRYIDFENGNDANAGTATNTAWKHHPWDANATGTAAAGSGLQTYVFKRGVIYRGQLLPDESGAAGTPIRLTSDPAWGTGAACLYGSTVVTNWQQGPAGIQANIPSPGSVWYADLNFLPRMVCMLDATGAVTRIPLAREPDWTITDPLDPLLNCWRWDSNSASTNLGSGARLLGFDSMLNNSDPNYYTNALVWTEWSNLMSDPYAAKIEAYDAARHGIVFQAPWGGDSYTLIVNQRYWIEDKPHYLDTAGEFWFERTGASAGRLYLRLPGDLAPSNATIEVARYSSMIYKYAGTWNNVDISGLTFRFGNIYWPLEYRDFQDYPKVPDAVVHFEGTGKGLAVRNCVFEYVPQAVRFRAYQASDRMDEITVADNDIRFCDHGAIDVLSGSGSSSKPGSLGAVAVMRNCIKNTGLRPYRVNGHHTIVVTFPERAEIAGNMLELVGGAGLFIFGGKPSVTTLAVPYDAPLTRILMHHNKVKHALLCANDWGAIESWQGGTFYVYNNVSWNPLARQNYAPNRFGGAYYLDGSFKNYHCNNIAWGAQAYVLNKWIDAPQGFQEIIGYNNTFANNSVYRFKLISRRQEADAGRNKYLGNVFDSNGSYVFDHAPNSAAAVYDSLAYDYNVVTRVSNIFGRFEYGGATYASLAPFAAALNTRSAMRWATGIQTNGLVFEDAIGGNFRPRANSPAIDLGVQAFVPWTLYMCVGEWHFTLNRLNPATVIDEAWYMGPAWTSRETYRLEPTFPLTGVNITSNDFGAGPLENWCAGALRLNGVNQHLAATGSGPQTKSLDIGTNSFVLETYFRSLPNHTGGVLAAKVDTRGYSLHINEHGCACFSLRQGGVDVFTRQSGIAVNDGQWHHLLVEFRRAAPAQLTLYLDGVVANGEAVGTLPTAALFITNSAQFLVGKGPAGGYFAGEFDYVRVARGTLADAATRIEELYDWQFSGPFLADFRGVPPAGRRDAGALEAAYVTENLPRITRQVTNVVIDLGAAGGVRVAALNADTYQWRDADGVLASATNAALAFDVAQADAAGVYVLTVSNSAGAVECAPITVTVAPEPYALVMLPGLLWVGIRARCRRRPACTAAQRRRYYAGVLRAGCCCSWSSVRRLYPVVTYCRGQCNSTCRPGGHARAPFCAGLYTFSDHGNVPRGAEH